MFEFFEIIFVFLSAVSSAASSWLLLSRRFVGCFILTSKCTCINLLNSGIVIEPVLSGILFEISVTFLLKPVLVARLVMSGILLSTSVVFVFKATLVARLVIPGVLFSISMAFVLRAAVITKPVILGILFWSL